MYRVGIDIGSTTIKVVVLDDDDRIVFSQYERHLSEIIDKTRDMLGRILPIVNDEPVSIGISGSAGMGLANDCHIPFVQEVYATRNAARHYIPDTDAIIELGGEDAKILFLTGGLEVRMNGSCAGGTGAFIDQMATLLGIGRDDMEYYASRATQTYTIASRCGVFAKTDVQPLINQGAKVEDIAASILVAVVNQTIAGLAQGRKITGRIVYLGGPLTFIPTLRARFDEALGTKGICPDNSLYYVALGTALTKNSERLTVQECIDRIESYSGEGKYVQFEPLFKDDEDYRLFKERHDRDCVRSADPAAYVGKAYLGIDSGSTTIKMCIISENGDLLLSRYSPNNGNPIQAVESFLMSFYEEFPYIRLAGTASTGYGEDLMKAAFDLDYSLVETQAHFIGARFFMPDVDFIIDIGGQDMKCFKIRDDSIDDIFLNEACSSGCGSFLQTFAVALGKSVSEFAAAAIKSQHPVDLGSRCTVFMNSSVKQAQKDGALLEDISAGLAISVVKNAIYKVIRATSAESLGRHIVVQGGTFLNDAVLRAFEKEIGADVIRPNIAGLMGAFGAALYAKRRSESEGRQESSILSEEEIREFTHDVKSTKCNGCTNHCLLTINTFAGGRRLISGNRCERPVAKTKVLDPELTDIYAYKEQLFDEYASRHNSAATRGTMGLPMALGMWELLPFWHTLFTDLGWDVVVSGKSNRDLYVRGQGSIPSDTVCFPAKLMHGHIEALLDKKVDAIFLPCSSYNVDEEKGTNHFNCPVVAYYAEVVHSNMDLRGTPFYYPYLSLENEKHLTRRIAETFGIPKRTVAKAVEHAFQELHSYHEKVVKRGEEIVERAHRDGKRIIVLCGRPYHVDGETNHGIDRLILTLGAYVISEDSISYKERRHDVRVLNQWTYHARLYDAAYYVREHEDMDLVQFVSFGCGLDAVTSDEVREILREKDRIYTMIKIDEITNVGAVRIRLRSLFAAIEEKNNA